MAFQFVATNYKAMKIVVVIVFVAVYLQEIHAKPVYKGTHNSPGDLAPSAVTKRRQARQAGVCGCGAHVYDHPNYRGRSLLVRQQNADFNNDWFDNRVESIAVVGTCKWIFYEDANFSGTPHLLTVGYYSSAPRWGGPGNRISSARALPPDGSTAIVLFQHRNFLGRMVTLYNSHAHLWNHLHFNDQVSSVIVIGGSWTLYVHSEYSGRSSYLTRGEYATINFGENTLSSVRRH